MENKPHNHGQPGSVDKNPVNQSGQFADGRSISDLSKNKGKEKDDAAYANEEESLPEEEKKRTEGEKQAESKPEDFEPFNLDEIDDDEKN